MAFMSSSSNLVEPNDTAPNYQDIFLREEEREKEPFSWLLFLPSIIR
jgi:hypothetical protein